MPRARVLLVIAASAWLGGCGQAPRHGPRARASEPADKERLFADPGLVPTREGERVRRELALAGELEAALGPLERVERVAATVELAPTPARVLVTLGVAEGDDERARTLQTIAERAVASVVGPEAQATVILDTVGEHEPTRDPNLPLPLALALLGLGVSAGIAIERYRHGRRR